MIPFNKPPVVGNEEKYIHDTISKNRLSGDGEYTKKCDSWMENRFKAKKVLLTTSCTTALDMAALLCELSPGDEVILPSYTFPSTATAFVLVGARLVFVDVRPDTMNIDETKIEEAITDKTKVIAVVHYAGISCEMDTIMDIAKRHGLKVVEDAAQAFMSTYKGRALGTIGDFGCFSFHETKNYSMGEGGAIVINNAAYIERAEILREKGTNRSQFRRGQVNKYYWIDFGDSYLPSELNAAFLWAQLEMADQINNERIRIWEKYNEAFQSSKDKMYFEIPFVPNKCIHNGHMYYIKCKNIQERSAFIGYLKEKGVSSVFHYIPLHSSPAGCRYGRFHGVDKYTTRESERLVRLPIFYRMTDAQINQVIAVVDEFYSFLNNR